MKYANAVETKYLGPTSHRGARIKAKCLGINTRYKIVPYDHRQECSDAHLTAAMEVVPEGYVFTTRLITETGYLWVYEPKEA